jgi:hypothetical protein
VIVWRWPAVLVVVSTTRAGAAFFLVALSAALPACGETKPATAPREEQPATGVLTSGNPATGRGPCQRVGRADEGMLRLCFKPNIGDGHGQFVVDTGATTLALRVLPPGRVGHWAWGALSPDGETILAQWSAECEVPIAFLVDANGGTPTPVTGEADWANSPESLALGWTTDRRAIVFLPQGPACGSGVDRAGVYLYAQSGAGKLLLEARDGRSPVEGSTEPRTVASLRRTAG